MKVHYYGGSRDGDEVDPADTHRDQIVVAKSVRLDAALVMSMRFNPARHEIYVRSAFRSGNVDFVAFVEEGLRGPMTIPNLIGSLLVDAAERRKIRRLARSGSKSDAFDFAADLVREDAR